MHEETTCQLGTSDGVDPSYDPDIFLVTAFTKCHPPSYWPDPPDGLAVTVFWQWYDWFGSQWKDGEVYDIGGCYDWDIYLLVGCTEWFSSTNDDVPIGPYLGVNCRRGDSIHMIWHHLTQEDTRFYLQRTSPGLCQ